MAKSSFKANPAKTVPRPAAHPDAGEPEEDFEFETPSKEAYPAWPGDLEPGSILKGQVVGVDATGGKTKLGTIDIDTGQETLRFYVNKPATDVLKRAMKKANVDWGNLEGHQIGVRFDEWAGKRPNEYRLFSIGIVG